MKGKIDFHRMMIDSLSEIDRHPKNIRLEVENYTNSLCFKFEEPDKDLTFHFDYVDGCVWNEDMPPLCNLVYSDFPTAVFFSRPCKVVVGDRMTVAVYVSATAVIPQNDDTLDCWKEWVEMPTKRKKDDWSFIEDAMRNNKVLKVSRWHYVKQV